MDREVQALFIGADGSHDVMVQNPSRWEYKFMEQFVWHLQYPIYPLKMATHNHDRTQQGHTVIKKKATLHDYIDYFTKMAV